MVKFADYISDGIVKCRIVKDALGKVDIVAIYANKQSELVTGKPIGEILNKGMKEVFPSIADSIFDWPKILSEAAMTSDHNTIEQYVTGFEKYVKFSVFGYEDDTFYLAMQDLTEKKEIRRLILQKEREIKHLENELKIKANEDMLTKLYNFQFLNESIKNSILSYEEENINFCVFALDIDELKKLNMIYGIYQADIMLQNIARILSANSRKIDVVGRYGNDKFMIIFNNVDIEIAKIMAEKIKNEIKNYSVNFDNKLSVCGSIVEYRGETLEKFIEKSEILITKAQSMGKGIILS